MNKFVTVCMIAVLSTLSVGCANEKVIDGVNYGTYGLFNEDKVKDPNIQYRVVKGNVIWGIILAETIVAPVYFFGFALHEPTGAKNSKELAK